jgi:Txe/YoeB family toxin of Txe-Axe toxin-antitoxin module
MKSQASDDFWKLFAQLPNEVKRQAHQAFKQFQNDPFYPGLNFEEVDKQNHIWSARVTRQFRVLGARTGDEIRWFWIGTHREYEKIIKGR